MNTCRWKRERDREIEREARERERERIKQSIFRERETDVVRDQA